MGGKLFFRDRGIAIWFGLRLFIRAIRERAYGKQTFANGKDGSRTSVKLAR